MDVYLLVEAGEINVDKLSTYHSAITQKIWLVAILTINQIIVTLYCTKVAVTILITAIYP